MHRPFFVFRLLLTMPFNEYNKGDNQVKRRDTFMANRGNADDFDGWNGEICTGCDLPSHVNALSLCDDCTAKLERDLIRSRDWDASATAFDTPVEELENLRLRIIREYGTAYELIVPPTHAEVKVQKQFQRIITPPLNQNLPDTVSRALDSYTENDVVDMLEQILASTPHYTWRELQEVAVILQHYFPDLNPKVFGYKSLRRLIQAHPKKFQTRWDNPKKKRSGQIYIRLTNDHTQKIDH